MKDAFNNFNELPDIVQTKILDYFLYEKARLYDIYWLDTDLRLKDLNLFCNIIDKITEMGYIKIDTNVKRLIADKFPNITLNKIIEKQYLRRLIEKCWIQVQSCKSLFHILPGNPLRRNVYLAGGYFTEYRENVFTKEFPKFYKYFKSNKDIDLFYNNDKLPASQYNKYYMKVDGFDKNVNLIVGKNNQGTEVIDRFDFDCCKIFYSYDDNELYAHSSLILEHCAMRIPSFFEIKIISDCEFVVRHGACVCERFKRVLKYMMKGFYDENFAHLELEQARKLLPFFIDPSYYETHCCLCAKPLYQSTKQINF